MISKTLNMKSPDGPVLVVVTVDKGVYTFGVTDRSGRIMKGTLRWSDGVWVITIDDDHPNVMRPSYHFMLCATIRYLADCVRDEYDLDALNKQLQDARDRRDQARQDLRAANQDINRIRRELKQ